jgi:hypothetical protein
MKPFYKTSEFYINLALAVVGAIEGMQGLPGSVTQIAGLVMMALSAILHTTSRTIIKQAAAASIAVPVPDAKKE